MKLKYYVYNHKKPNGDIFYVGVSKYYFLKSGRIGKYDRAFQFSPAMRNKYWQNIYNECDRKITVEIIKEFDNIEDAYSLEIKTIAKYGKIHNGTGTLANMQDGGFVSDHGKSVCSYDYDGNFLNKYDSVNHAAKELKIKSKDQIYQSILYGFGTYGYRFLYCSENYTEKLERYVPSNECYQYSRTGRFIKKWRTVEDAASQLGIDRGSIRNNIYKRSVHCKGFVWSYTPMEFTAKHFEIGQFDLSGNMIKQYPNAGKAEAETGVFNSTILLCCKCKMKLGGGFIWKFIEIE